ncbi:PrsW family intramembrane metalloprotease [Streptomyces sp. DH37]|uniref:PrsW family intramembrane metalloprotease n=1 Tax=Streptomyces sp. DH37 TaxID=3040122 RepID=UPI00244243B7|nr:PrsW family intramembrane metalloprotease [Streptomyces sp. DH37]MDG9704967.1 PrsW family intramembrane metalloprotease [Streptomyces sp. DH37]
MHQEVSAPPADGRGSPRGAPRWHSVRAAAVAVPLLLCGAVILGLVHEQTGSDGFLVGLGLAVLPVPPLLAAFRWLDRAAPAPRRNLLFAFGWGACAATLVAITVNGFATDWLASSVLPRAPDRADALGTTLVAPVVEETAKAGAVLLLFLHRPRDFGGVVSGVVTAGITATGFAFTENILYLGRAFGEDLALGHSGLESTTLGTFVQRVVMAPLAHPLFTVLVGLGFGAAASVSPRRRTLRTALPLLGLAAAVTLHAVWNGAATLPRPVFLTVYGLFMAPVLVVVTGLALWARRRLLRTVRATLPRYAAAGWLAPPEPYALGCLRARALARDLARRHHGRRAARAVAEYHRAATCLAVLRARAEHGAPPPGFPAHERALLRTLHRHRPLASPATASAALEALPRPSGIWWSRAGVEHGSLVDQEK